MGRKSLAPERREQILDAFEACIARYGLAGSSLERVAEEAGVQRTIIRHYVGNKDAVVTAVVDRMVTRYQAELQAALEALAPSDRLAGVLDYLFGGGFTEHAEDERVLNELFAVADQDDRTRELLFRTYRAFEQNCLREVAAAYPAAAPEARHAVAYSIMCLAFSNATFLCIGFDDARNATARAGAEAMLATLAGDATSGSGTN